MFFVSMCVESSGHDGPDDPIAIRVAMRVAKCGIISENEPKESFDVSVNAIGETMQVLVNLEKSGLRFEGICKSMFSGNRKKTVISRSSVHIFSSIDHFKKRV